QDGCWFSATHLHSHSPQRTGLLWLACAFAAMAIASAPAPTATEIVLHNFSSPTKGENPEVGVIRDSVGNSTEPLSTAAQRGPACCTNWIRPAMRRCCTASRAGPTAATPTPV